MQKNKSAAKWIQILSIAILLANVGFMISQTGIVSDLSRENIYWERARFLLGQGGATYYNGSSLCSLGYSLILLPICALIRSPYAAYKAAILLNGIVWCGCYLLAVKTTKKIFREENESFLSVVCLLAVLCPVYGVQRSITGPEMIVQFLLWCVFYLLLDLQEQYKKQKLIILTVCLILAGFFQIATLGIILAVLVILGGFVRKKRLEETSFLSCCLAILIGLAVGNIAERVVLYSFASDLDIVVKSSLEVLLDGFMAGWENGYLAGWFTAVIGKVYSVAIGSCMLIFPVLWYFIKKISKRLYSEPAVWMIGIFVVQMLAVALFDNSLSPYAGYMSLTYLEPVFPVVIVTGVVLLKNGTREYCTELGYMLIMCLCTFMVGNTFTQKG